MAIGTPSQTTGPTGNLGVVNSRATGSYTPTAGQVLFAAIISQSDDANGLLSAANGRQLISDTHSGITWTETITNGIVFDPAPTDNYLRLYVYHAVVPPSPGSGATTFMFNNSVAPVDIQRNQTIFSVISMAGVDIYNPVVQTKTATGTTATSLTATLDATPLASSLVLGFCVVSYGASGTDTNVGIPTNHTELSETQNADPDFNQQLIVSYDNTSAGTGLTYNNFPTGGTATSGSAIIAVEVRSGGKGIPPGVI